MSSEISDHPVVGNSLLCGESRDFIGFSESNEVSSPERRFGETGGEDVFFVGSDEFERVVELIRMEPGWGFVGRSPSESGRDSFLSDAVDWIVNASASFVFHHHTTYLSITYLLGLKRGDQTAVGEIRDKTIEFDEKRDVQRAEFIVPAYMQGGRFSDGWGSCERREKRFNKPNRDIPSTAETRAKNKACQNLLGIGEYRPGISHGH